MISIDADDGVALRYRVDLLSDNQQPSAGAWKLAQRVPQILGIDTSRPQLYTLYAVASQPGHYNSDVTEYTIKVEKVKLPHSVNFDAGRSVLDVATSDEDGSISYTVLLDGSVVVEATEKRGGLCTISIDQSVQGRYEVRAIAQKRGWAPSDVVKFFLNSNGSGGGSTPQVGGAGRISETNLDMLVSPSSQLKSPVSKRTDEPATLNFTSGTTNGNAIGGAETISF